MRITASALAAPFILLFAMDVAEANVEPPAGSPKFLTLPFDDPGVFIRQGWYYDTSATALNCPHPAGDIAGGVRHCGIDYFKGPLGQRQTFEVLAAASGRAMRFDGSRTAGTFVIIEHDEVDPTGRPFCTRYLHLNPNDRTLPSNRWVPVERGSPIGMAGDSGEGVVGIHLHFEALAGGCNLPGDPRFDPYDIAGRLIRAGIEPTKDHYPGNDLFAGCGPNFLWTECPPELPRSSTDAPSAGKECHLLTSANPVPQGFAAAYDVLSPQRNLLVRASCTSAGATVTAGGGSTNQYVYRYGYEWRNNDWRRFDLRGGQLLGDAWYVGQASADLPRSTAELGQDNFFVAYVCTWTGSEWKCGCRDSACAQPFWQLQAFRR